MSTARLFLAGFSAACVGLLTLTTSLVAVPRTGAFPPVATVTPRMPATEPAPTPAPAATGSSTVIGSSDTTSSSPRAEDLEADVRLAAEDLERGRAGFFKGKGAQRLKEAAAAFTAVIDRLSPHASSLDAEGRRVLARALDLRAQTSLRKGQNESADSDFRRLVETDPAYEPDPAATSRKILDRFRKIRAPLIAVVTIEAIPPEAEIVWNGRSLGTAARLFAPLTVLAGPFVLGAHLACFEDKEIEGTLGAGEARSLKARIDPSGRSVRFETVPEGFDVELDGTLVGRTSAPPDAATAEPGPAPPISAGTLVVPCIPAGDHPYALRRECYMAVTGSVSVIVDFVDRDPVVVRVVPEKRVAHLSVDTEVPGAQITYEGVSLGPAPVEDRVLCPGFGRLEVRSGERILWADGVELVDGDVHVRAPSRPLLRSAILETGDRGRLASSVAARIRERIDRLGGFNHVTGASAEQLREIDREGARSRETEPRRLDLGADLALTVDGTTSSRGDLVRFRLAPAIGGFFQTDLCGVDDEACLDRFFSGLETKWPTWGGRTGLGVVDTLDEKGARIVSVQEPARGAGVREGDILVSAGGKPVTGTVTFRSLITESLEGSDPVSVTSSPVTHHPGRADDSSSGDREDRDESAPHGTERTLPIVVLRGASRVAAALPVRRASIIPPPSSSPVPVPRMIAVADFEASVLPPGERRNAALLTLASLLIGAGEPVRALALALDRPGWSDDVPGPASAGTAAFLAGLCHEKLGARDRALADFTKAASTDNAELWSPDGLPVPALARIKMKSLSR